MKNQLHRPALAALISVLLFAPSSSASNETPAPTVSGNKIVFPPGSMDEASIKIFTVAPRTAIANHVAGHLVWDEDLTVRVYTPVTGRVREILVHVGETVQAGAVLARLDSPDFGQAQADAHKAAADLTLASRNLDRLRELYDHGAVAKKEVDEAEDSFESARSEQQRATARLVLYGEKDANVVDGSYGLSTPIGGVVVDRNVNVGEELRPDLMLANDPRFVAPQFIVSDPRKLWVALDATETELPFLKVGQPLKIRSRAYPDHVFDGTIETIGSALDPSTRTVKIIGVVENADLLLKAELYVDVEIGALPNVSDGVVIDSSAVFSREGHSCVFLEIAPNTYEVHQVNVETENAGEIVVRNGLSIGQHVVSDGRLLLQSLLEDGGKS